MSDPDPDRRAAGVRRGDPRLRKARVRHPRAARRAHRQRQRAAQPGDVRADRRARVARRGDPGAVRRLRRRRGRHVPAVRGVRSRADPDGLLLGQHDHRRRRRPVRHRGAQAGDPRRRRARPRRGDRDVRARGRIGRRQPELQGRARQRRLRDQRAEDVDHGRPRRRPHPARVPNEPDRQQARGAIDDLRADRCRRARGPRDRDDGRPRGQRRVLHRLPRPRRSARRPAGSRLDAADGRAQPRAADHRRPVAGHGPARVRRRARLRQGAQAVRQADRKLPGAPAPPRRSRGRDRVDPAARVRHRARASTRTPVRCSRARLRWRS